jgi:hypothetical protein
LYVSESGEIQALQSHGKNVKEFLHPYFFRLIGNYKGRRNGLRHAEAFMNEAEERSEMSAFVYACVSGKRE